MRDRAFPSPTAARGHPPPTFCWKRDGRVLAVGNTSALALPRLTEAECGEYVCDVSNDRGTVATASVTVAIAEEAPTVTTQPTDAAVVLGATATFTATGPAVGTSSGWAGYWANRPTCCVAAAEGVPNPTYVWTHNDTAVPGATGSTLTVTDCGPQHVGHYTCVVSNSAGSRASRAATLELSPAPPVINRQPVSVSVKPGEPCAFTVEGAWGGGGLNPGRLSRAARESQPPRSQRPPTAGTSRVRR